MYSSDRYKQIHNQRISLPIYQMKDEIIDALQKNQVIVVSGETGSGKTTQLPLYILEDMVTNIIYMMYLFRYYHWLQAIFVTYERIHNNMFVTIQISVFI